MTDREEILKRIAEAAVESEKRTGLPAELTAAQCIHESGWLQYAPGNNCFGIKFASRHKQSQLLQTTEHRDGADRKEFHRFAAFDTLGDCFTDHALLITTRGVYAQAWAEYQINRDLRALILGIAAKYATDPNYAARILTLATQGNVVRAIAEARGQA